MNRLQTKTCAAFLGLAIGLTAQITAIAADGGDALPKVSAALTAVYPYSLLKREVDGSAKIEIIVGADGSPMRVSVLMASAPEFGMSLAASAWGFKFSPATKNGTPVVSVVLYSRDFKVADSLDADKRHALAVERTTPGDIRSLTELDHPLRPVFQRAVTAPRDIKDPETVLVEFLVDEKGQVESPRIDSPNPDAFGYAAVQAVSAWIFDPPLSHGIPVMVRVMLPVSFKPVVATPSS